MKWVVAVVFELDFIIVILRSNTTNGKSERKTFVVLGCERGIKYRKYKKIQRRPQKQVFQNSYFGIVVPE